MGDVLYIVMPCYNEELNIRCVVDSWYGVLSDKDERSRLVVADSGSTDETHRILEGMRERLPQLVVMSDTSRFHGPKCMALYDYAISSGADWIFQTDSDGQTNPDEFEGFWSVRREYEGIFGERRVRGDGMLRWLVEKALCILLRLYFGVAVPDANAPFRLMRAGTVAKYLGRMNRDYNLPNVMLTTYFHFYRERTFFREISFSARKAGKNSIDLVKILGIGVRAMVDFRRLRLEMVR